MPHRIVYHHHRGSGFHRRHRVAVVRPPTTVSYYWYRRPIGIIVSILFTIAVIVTISVTTFYFTSPSDFSDGDLQYGPTDTRIIQVPSYTFCQSLQMTTFDFYYTASLYMLDFYPTLTGHEKFSVDTSEYDFVDYPYYLYPGSNFSVSACFSDYYLPASGTFFLIKGHDAHVEWVNSNYNAPVLDSFVFNASCNSNFNNSHSYNIESEDYYFLAFQSPTLIFNIHMDFFRTRYELPPADPITDSCSTDNVWECSVSVPLTSKATALLMVTPNFGTTLDYTETVDISTVCIPRIWMYSVIVLSCLIGVLLIMVPISVCIIIKCCRNKKAPRVTTAESVNAPLLTAEPHLQQPQYEYGSTYIAPPVYEP